MVYGHLWMLIMFCIFNILQVSHLTLKIHICSRRNLFLFSIFPRKEGMTFHMNHLLDI